MDTNEYSEEIIYITWSPWEASLIKNLLLSYEIPCRFIREVPDILPFTVDGLGRIQIAVSSHYADEARKLLEDFKSGERLLEEEEEPNSK